MQGQNTLAAYAILAALSVPAAQADISAKAVLDKVYGAYNPQQKCWVTMDESEQHYCMTIDRTDKRETVTGNRLYVLATGTAVNEKGEADNAHVISGLIGAFVLEEHNGQTEIIASDPKMPMGTYGLPPTNWRLSLLGPSDYWGWQNTDGAVYQGISGSSHTLLAPYGHTIRNLAGFWADFDDSGSCCGDQNTRTNIKTQLVIDTSKNTARVYPLRVTVTGQLNGKKLKPKTWTLPFDFKKWTYREPPNWPLTDIAF